MGVGSLRHSALFFLFFCFSSGSSVPKNPLLEATHQRRTQVNQEKHILSASSVHTTQLDNIPTVNPSTLPTTPTPFVNPTYPPSPTTTDPTTTPIPIPPTLTPTTPTTTPSSGGAWCIASQSAAQNALQVALDYACGYGAADCSAINQGGSCYNPNTLQGHASYAFNDYYQKHPSPTSCSFGGTAQLSNTDPSTGSCRFAASSSSTSMNSPPTPTMSPPTPTMSPPTPMMSTTPSTPTMPTTTTSPYTPSIATPGGGSTIYGDSPTDSPNSATSISSCMLLLFIMTGILGSLLAENYV